MTKYTPAPWVHGLGNHIFSGHRANDPDLHLIARMGGIEEPCTPRDVANTARIVACVNALDGVENPVATIEAAYSALEMARDHAGSVAAHEHILRALTLLGPAK